MPIEFSDDPIPKPAYTYNPDDNAKDRSISNLASEGVDVGERHTAIVRIAGLLRNRAIPRGVAYNLLRSWNAQRVKTPFEQDEFDEEFARSFDNWMPGTRTDGTDEEIFRALSVAQLYALADEKGGLKWLVPNMIALGASHIISAPSAHGKTWAALTLGRAVASGSDWAGVRDIDQGAVLLIDEEMGAVLNARRMRQLEFAPDLPFYTVTQQGFRLDSLDAIGWLVRFIAANDVKLTILDSLRRVHNQDENSNTEMRRLLPSINAIAATGCAVVILHHDRKKGTDSDVTHEKSSGASDIIAQCSMAFGVTRTRDTYTLECRKSRIVADTDVPKLSFRLEDFIGEHGTKTTLVIPVTEEALRSSKETDDEQRVLAAVYANPCASTNQLGDLVKIKKVTLISTIARLVDKGAIQMTPGPNRSKTYHATRAGDYFDADTTY